MLPETDWPAEGVGLVRLGEELNCREVTLSASGSFQQVYGIELVASAHGLPRLNFATGPVLLTQPQSKTR